LCGIDLLLYICSYLSTSLMALASLRRTVRRKPRQRRALATVDAILEAVVRLLKRGGFPALTTNRIAEAAGVSIGSVYQYFSDKNAIFRALHQRHIDEIDRLITATLVKHAASPLDVLISALIDGMVEAHTGDPELYALLSSEVPHRADRTEDFATRLHGVLRLALSARLPGRGDIDTITFTVAHLAESLSHAAALARPPGLSIEEAKAEAVKAALGYLHLAVNGRPG
jgi:AcrR family transcriptional regulator